MSLYREFAEINRQIQEEEAAQGLSLPTSGGEYGRDTVKPTPKKYAENGESPDDGSKFNLLSCIVNDKISLKNQLIVSFSLMAIITGGLTLGICIGQSLFSP